MVGRNYRHLDETHAETSTRIGIQNDRRNGTYKTAKELWFEKGVGRGMHPKLVAETVLDQYKVA